MSEETEMPDAAPEGRGTSVDPVSINLAIAGADREEANAFLKKQGVLVEKQSRLADLQAKELAHELELRHWSLWVRHLSALLKLTLEASAAIVLIGLVAMIAGAVWSAAHDDGLVIEAFSVPPELAAAGLTGQVVAARIQDSLSALQAATNSSRAPSSFANNWGDDIKVEIPDTGMSVGEASRYLHRVFGHQTYISGEVVDRGGKITITARTNANPAASATGADSDVDAVLDQVAESIFARTQPYRYGVHLLSQGRRGEAGTFLRNVAHTGPVAERAWAWAGLFNVYIAQGRMPEAEGTAKASIALRPDFAWGWSKVAGVEEFLGRPERALSAAATTLNLLDNGGAADLRPEGIALMKDQENSDIAGLRGDYGGELAVLRKNYSGFSASRLDVADMVQTLFARPGASPAAVANVAVRYGVLLALQHDMAPARRMLDADQAFRVAMTQYGDARRRDTSDMAGFVAQGFRFLAMQIALTGQDWRQLLAVGHAFAAADPDLAARGRAMAYPPTQVWPLLALAQAGTGDFKAAHAQIDRTPADCDLCIRMRGRIDALEKNSGGADTWFAKAESLAPSTPFADEDWGRALLERGKPDDALAKFILANQKGPHFGDSLEGWGEALMAKNQSHLALAKFAEAEKYAPNWGRLHLKWGEALVYAGHKDEARAQFARAAQFDLTPSEKAELAGITHG